jgi:glycolate oxidase FAD binding subunit
VLAENNQVTSFNVDSVEGDTIGSAYAKGSADLRDAILGIKIIDGQGRLLTFGGQVMKNVAGYDVARLLVGSKGQLAIICDISFKVIPKIYGTKKKSIVFTTLKPNEKKSIATKKCINHGLKNIFDPLGVFI